MQITWVYAITVLWEHTRKTGKFKNSFLYKFPEMARLLVQKGSNKKHRDRSGATPLALACRSNRTLALFLLSIGANASTADNEGNTPLHHACARHPNDVELVDRLLAAGAPVSVLFAVNCYSVLLILLFSRQF